MSPAFQVLDPTASRPDSTLPVASRRQPLAAGAAFGVLHNSKPNADVLLRALSRRLQRDYGLQEHLWYNKKVLGGPGFPSPPDWIDALASGTVAVLAASGD
jgi:hypothetical protein